MQTNTARTAHLHAVLLNDDLLAKVGPPEVARCLVRDAVDQIARLRVGNREGGAVRVLQHLDEAEGDEAEVGAEIVQLDELVPERSR